MLGWLKRKRIDGDRIREIPIRSILSNPFQPRKEVDESSLQCLMQSILEYGVVVPLILRPIDGSVRYELVAGQRRLLACRRLGWKTVPAVIRDLSDHQVTEVSLIENLQRRDLSAVEQAEALDRLTREFVRLTHEDLARRLGLGIEEVKARSKLLSLSVVAREAVITNLINEEQALLLTELPKEAQQIEAISRICKEGLTTRQARKVVREILDREGVEGSEGPEDPKREGSQPAATEGSSPSVEGVSSPSAGKPSSLPLPPRRPLARVDLRSLLDTFAVGEPVDRDGIEGIARDLLAGVRNDPATHLAWPSGHAVSGGIGALAAHLRTVCGAALLAGIELGMTDAELLRLGTAALLHDVGRIDAPEAPPPPDGIEYPSWVQEHARRGYERLREIPWIDPEIARAALEHHERANGSGHPAGLAADELGPYSLLVGMAERLVREGGGGAGGPAHAMQELIFATGRGAFPNHLMRALLRALSLYPVGSTVQLASGETARVVRANPDDVRRPVVEILTTPAGDTVPPGRMMDLLDRRELQVAYGA